MNPASDLQLLRAYASARDEEAFREIVRRHAGLVYAAALRQADSPDLAEDAAQSVFTDLARKAAPLSRSFDNNGSLLGWLFRSARYAALNQRRGERRRQARERQVMQSVDTAVPAPAPEWDGIKPVLDEAMAGLDESDRNALLCRFFKEQDFRAIAAALGVSEDAAQKRVSRALERLRAQFARRGITTTALALGSALTAHAVAEAPAGLSSAWSSAALAGAASGAITQSIVMTMLQKCLIPAVLVAAISSGVYEARQASRLRTEVQALQQSPASDDQLRQAVRERDEALKKLAFAQDENRRLNSNMDELMRLRNQVGKLRDKLDAAQAGDPFAPDKVSAAQMEKVRNYYARLLKQLNLPPDKESQFLRLVGAWWNISNEKYGAIATAPDPAAAKQEMRDLQVSFQNSLAELIGKDGINRYWAFANDVPAYTMLDSLNAHLPAPLTDDQGDALVKIIATEPMGLTHGFTGEVDPAFLGSPSDADTYMQHVADAYARIQQNAATVLTPDQAAALGDMLTNSLAVIRANGNAFAHR